jgi:hypothetical protein
MRLEALENTCRWRATVDYRGSQGLQSICLMEDWEGRYYWFIADFPGDWPWEAVRRWEPRATARMVQEGKMRLVKGEWPDVVCGIITSSPAKVGGVDRAGFIVEDGSR